MDRLMGDSNSMSDPLISIILPTYNRAYSIANTIQSVLDQYYRNYELIIIDDGSEDDTQEVVNKFQDERVVYVKKEINEGANYARNIGLARAKGEYIAFIDSDNSWLPDHLSVRMEKIQKSESPIISFGRMTLIGIDGKKGVFPNANFEELSNRETLIKLMIFENRIDTNTVVISRDCIGVSEGFDLNFTRFQDWDFFMGLLLNDRNNILFDDRFSVEHYFLEDSITNNKRRYWINVLRFVNKYSCIIDMYNLRLDLDNFLAGLMQTEISYHNIYSVLEEEADIDILELANKLIFMAADRDKATNNLLKKIIEHTDINEANIRIGMPNCGSIIAIYGNGFFGKKLLEILRNSDQSVKYVIDRMNLDHKSNGIHYVRSIDYVDKVDCVIVAMAYDAETVAEMLKDKGINNVKTIEEILD